MLQPFTVLPNCLTHVMHEEVVGSWNDERCRLEGVVCMVKFDLMDYSSQPW
jgi:hypothetical protein